MREVLFKVLFYRKETLGNFRNGWSFFWNGVFIFFVFMWVFRCMVEIDSFGLYFVFVEFV